MSIVPSVSDNEQEISNSITRPKMKKCYSPYTVINQY